MDSHFAQVATIFISQSFLIFFVYLLAEFREPARKWRRIWLIGVAAITMANLLLVTTKGYAFYIRWFPLTMTIWHVGVILLCSHHRGASVLFNILTVCNLAFTAGLFGILAMHLMPQNIWADCIGRVVAYLLLWALVRKLRAPYLRMLGLLKRGWALLCAFPLLTVLFFYLCEAYYARSAVSVTLCAFVMALLTLFYSVVWLFFQRVLEEDEARRDRDLLSVQVSSMRGRLEATQAAEETIRIERHDLKHRLQAIQAMLETGEKDAALQYIGASQKRLDAQKSARLCQNPILDAILGSYLGQAKEAGVRVETNLAIPTELPVDAMELSTVFANALENAVHGCQTLAADKRRLLVTCVCSPSLMIEIANTCDGTVVFDTVGVPVSTRSGHGTGTRSIAAFAKKYDAWTSYEMKNGWFRLQIAL